MANGGVAESRILVTQAVARNRHKRGGSAVLVSLSEAHSPSSRSAELMALDEALVTLGKIDDRKGRLVELLKFWGSPYAPGTVSGTWLAPDAFANCAATGLGLEAYPYRPGHGARSAFAAPSRIK